jgi:hypothetical protein
VKLFLAVDANATLEDKNIYLMLLTIQAEYSKRLVKTMSKRYRIEPFVARWIVIDGAGTRARTYTTEEPAEQDIECCQREAEMYRTAKILVEVAIEALVQMHGVDRETAARWVFSVMDVTH